jgi:hypothetical protein
VEASFLIPDINTSGATYESEDFTNPKFDTFTSFSTSIDSVYLTPRIWLGVQGCEWGVVTRYWHLRANEGDHDGFLDILGWEGAIDTGAFMFSQLDAYTVDFEVTRRFCFADTDLLFSVGARTASIEHFEGVTGITDTTDALINGYGRSYRASRGTGIVLGLYGRKPVFCNSCVNWYYNLRWSALWGKTETDVETFASVIGDDATAFSANGAATSVNDDMFIGEVQLGLEWNYPLVCLPANAFFRSGIEFQRWEGGSGGSESNSFAGIDVDDVPSAEVNTFADARGIDLDLVGFVMGAGLTW